MTAPVEPQELPVQELLAAYFSWQALDALAAAAWQSVSAVWALADLLTPEELREALVEALVAVVVEAEVQGRVRGVTEAPRPVNERALVPDVVAEYPRAPEEFEQRSETAPPLTEADRLDPYTPPVRDEELRERLTKAVETIFREAEYDELARELVELRERLVVLQERVAGEPEERLVEPVQEYVRKRESAAEQVREQITVRLERIARDEPIQAAQRGYQDGLRAAPDGPQGYRRGVNPDCCELCYFLWKEGYVYPIYQPMHRHTGCRCVPIPTTDDPGRSPLKGKDVELFDVLYSKYTLKTSGGSNA